MFELMYMLLSMLLVVLTSLLLLFFTKISKSSTKSKTINFDKWPKPYPVIGHLLAFAGLNQEEIFEWMSNIIAISPTSTIVVHNLFGQRSVYTGNSANVEHILKTQFPIYDKGPQFKTAFRDLFGDSLFTENGDSWKSQRLFASQEFTHNALQKYVQNVLNFEISERLIPFLYDAAKNNMVIDLQDILQRFAFDNICKISFGYDPEYVSLSLPEARISMAFDESISLCHSRFHAIFPILWKACRFLNIGSEKRLNDFTRMLREFAGSMIKSRKQDMKTEDQESDFLSRLLQNGQFDEKIAIDMVLSLILAGRDTSSAALTWFFWLLHRNRHVEQEILKEMNNNNSKTFAMGELKGMPYIQAALCEAMRLYPPVPADLKQVSTDDVLPDGTKVQKGTIVGIFTYAMGRSEKIWGPDWPEFRPDRWLKDETDNVTGKTKRSFVSRDAYSYPVFLAGPRICLGKEMAFLQMKSVVSAVLSRFKVVPVVDDGVDPVYIPETTAKMRGGLPVRIEERFEALDPCELN